MRKLSLLLFCFACSLTLLHAQVQINSPQSRIVYQRDKTNQANVLVTGLAPSTATRVEARLIPINGGQATDWATIPLITATNKAFRGNLTALAGWYQLSLRVWNNTTVIAESSVDRVGIGEVFIVAGQSNAVGIQTTEGTTDDRVSCVDFRDNDVHEQLLPVAFSQAGTGANIGPSNPLHIWGTLGEQLVRRLNVPVLFLGAAQVATTSEQWRKTAEGTGENSGLPYRRMGTALLHYAARTGLRAVLWHQGEGDVGRGGEQYFENLNFIINKSRQQLNYNALAWVISRATYTFGQTDESVISAQNRLASLVPHVFNGPYTDVLTGGENRFDNVHFGGIGLTRLTDLWNQSLTEDFFNRSTPFSVGPEAPLITTGHIVPTRRASGERIWVPYVQKGPFDGSNQFKAQLLRADGSVITESAASNQNPLSIQLPGDLPTGSYRTRVVASSPSVIGAVGEAFQVTQGGVSSGDNDQPIQPNAVGGQEVSSIIRIGYRYDSPSHGFTFLVNATSSVDVRLERIDGGYFPETNWGTASANNEIANFNYGRYYSPIIVGVGGVEAGRYRLSVRKSGETGNGQWVEVTLVDGRNTVYQVGNTEQIITPPPATTTTTPPSTTTTTTTPPSSTTTAPIPDPTTQPGTPPTTSYVQRIGYKYDAPTHGFQLLAQALGTVEMRLERLDGSFAETNWANSIQSEEFFSFNNYRYYSPVGMGIGGVEAGRYRLSVRKPGDANSVVSTEVNLQGGIHTITITDSGQPTVSSPWDKPLPVVSSGDVIIKNIGYKYDAPTHGFHLLADVTGSVEMRLERIDGGTFSETNWAAATPSTEFGGYSASRYYSPVSMGIGGVEAGRYRLSVRKTGDNSNGQSTEVELQNGLISVGSGSAVVRNEPVVSPPTNQQPTGQLVGLGYKYDMPTHGFQLLVNANAAVEVRLERLDGYFGDTDWNTATAGTQYAGYTYYRNYNPIAMGVGGVEPGRYRLSARLAGDTGTGTTIDITLNNGLFAVWAPGARQAISESWSNLNSPEDSWRVWPNPVDRIVTVSLPDSALNKTLRVEVITTTGATLPVQQATVKDRHLEVELRDLPTGLYLLRIADEHQPLQTVKVIKQ